MGKLKNRRKITAYDRLSLRSFAVLLERYNHNHKTHYSYGNAVKAIDAGEINGRCFLRGE